MAVLPEEGAGRGEAGGEGLVVGGAGLPVDPQLLQGPDPVSGQLAFAARSADMVEELDQPVIPGRAQMAVLGDEGPGGGEWRSQDSPRGSQTTPSSSRRRMRSPASTPARQQRRCSASQYASGEPEGGCRCPYWRWKATSCS